MFSCKGQIRRQAFYLNDRIRSLDNRDPGERNATSQMTRCDDILGLIKTTTADFLEPSKAIDDESPLELGRLAYTICRSEVSGQAIEADLRTHLGSRVDLHDTLRILKPLDKISKIYQAAFNITDFISRIRHLGGKICIEVVSVAKIPILELASQNTTRLHSQLQAHAGQSDEKQVKCSSERWPYCMQHAELQLVVFYEENPHIHVRSNYIGSSEPVCYLCSTFIRCHARFEVKADSQSRHTLWTIQNTIAFQSNTRAQIFRSALRQAVDEIGEKSRQVRSTLWDVPRRTSADRSPSPGPQSSPLPGPASKWRTPPMRPASRTRTSAQLASIEEDPGDTHLKVQTSAGSEETNGTVRSDSPTAVERSPSTPGMPSRLRTPRLRKQRIKLDMSARRDHRPPVYGKHQDTHIHPSGEVFPTFQGQTITTITGGCSETSTQSSTSLSRSSATDRQDSLTSTDTVGEDDAWSRPQVEARRFPWWVEFRNGRLRVGASEYCRERLRRSGHSVGLGERR